MSHSTELKNQSKLEAGEIIELNDLNPLTGEPMNDEEKTMFTDESHKKQSNKELYQFKDLEDVSSKNLIKNVLSNQQIENDEKNVKQKIIDNQVIMNHSRLIDNSGKSMKNDDKLNSELDKIENNVSISEIKSNKLRTIVIKKECLSNEFVKMIESDHFENVSEDDEFLDNEIVGKKNSNCEFINEQKTNTILNNSISDGQLSLNDVIENDHILKLKGIPYNATEDHVKEFFEGYRYKKDGIHIHRVAGRSIGKAFIEFESSADMIKAFDKNSQTLHPNDKRRIGLYRASRDELQICLDDNNFENIEINEFIRVNGILFNTTKKDIEEFFKPLKIAKDGIIISIDKKMRMTKNCYVQFESIEDAKKALLLNGEPLGSRYVRVMKSTRLQFKNQANLVLKSNLISNLANSKMIPMRKPSIHKSKVFNNLMTNRSFVEFANSSPENRNFSRTCEMNPHYFHNNSENRTIHNPIIGNSVQKSFNGPHLSNRSFSTNQSDYRNLRNQNKRTMSNLEESSNKRTKFANNGYYFQSFYNDEAEKNDSLDHLKVVQVKDLPNNCTTEALCEFFDQIDLIPKKIKLFADRELALMAEVTFRTFEDAKKSFLLSGARLNSQYGSRNVDVIVHPDLKNVNVINPSNDRSNLSGRSDHSSNYPNKNYFKNHSINYINHYPTRTRASNNCTYGIVNQFNRQDNNFSNPISIEKNESYHNQIVKRPINRNGLSNSHLINQLKNSLHDSIGQNGNRSSYNSNPYSRRHIEIN